MEKKNCWNNKNKPIGKGDKIEVRTVISLLSWWKIISLLLNRTKTSWWGEWHSLECRCPFQADHVGSPDSWQRGTWGRFIWFRWISKKNRLCFTHSPFLWWLERGPKWIAFLDSFFLRLPEPWEINPAVPKESFVQTHWQMKCEQ